MAGGGGNESRERERERERERVCVCVYARARARVCVAYPIQRGILLAPAEANVPRGLSRGRARDSDERRDNLEWSTDRRRPQRGWPLEDDTFFSPRVFRLFWLISDALIPIHSNAGGNQQNRKSQGPLRRRPNSLDG